MFGVIVRSETEARFEIVFVMVFRWPFNELLNNLSINVFEIFCETAFVIHSWPFLFSFEFGFKLAFGLMDHQGICLLVKNHIGSQKY